MIAIELTQALNALGVHIFSYNASEMIHEFVAVDKFGKGLSGISNFVHVYPTFGTINQNISSYYILEKLNTKILKFLSKFKI